VNTSLAFPAPMARLVEQLNRLPGIGPKSAQRLAFFLLCAPEEQTRFLTETITAVKEKIIFCSICQNMTETDPCPLCQSSDRDRTKICVVEEPLDVLALERSRVYEGMYHVLHGVISPADGVGPDDLKIQELLVRIRGGGVEEVIVATNPKLEGDAMSMYLQRLLVPFGVKVTRLARGLPVGSDLEYTDEVTLSRALEGRQEI